MARVKIETSPTGYALSRNLKSIMKSSAPDILTNYSELDSETKLKVTKVIFDLSRVKRISGNKPLHASRLSAADARVISQSVVLLRQLNSEYNRKKADEHGSILSKSLMYEPKMPDRWVYILEFVTANKATLENVLGDIEERLSELHEQYGHRRAELLVRFLIFREIWPAILTARQFLMKLVAGVTAGFGILLPAFKFIAAYLATRTPG